MQFSILSSVNYKCVFRSSEQKLYSSVLWIHGIMDDGLSTTENPTLSSTDVEAIKLFEMAVEMESHGSMSDAVQFYRKAFRLNDRVDLLYRNNKVPYSINKLKENAGKNAAMRVDEKKVSSINAEKLLQSLHNAKAEAPKPVKDIFSEDIDNSVAEEKLLKLNLDEPATSEISPLIDLPDDIWLNIIEKLLIENPESWFNFSITCKKNAYIGLASPAVWRKLCYLIYPNQQYEENRLFQIHHENEYRAAETDNMDEESDIEDFSESKDKSELSYPIPNDQLKILPQYDGSWKLMLQSRPFIKFGGCYISVVNYYSEGGREEFSSSWSNPVRTITYYRYLRFYPDGLCLKVLTSLRPHKVIGQLSRFNTSKEIFEQGVESTVGFQTNPSSKAVHSIFFGRWTITTDGEVHIKIEEGAVKQYIFHYFFQIASLGKVAHYGKLNWLRYYAVTKEDLEENLQLEQELLDFPLKNEKAFKFSKVRSFRIDN